MNKCYEQETSQIRNKKELKYEHKVAASYCKKAVLPCHVARYIINDMCIKHVNTIVSTQHRGVCPKGQCMSLN